MSKYSKGKWKAVDRAGAGWEIMAQVGKHDFFEYESTSDDFEAPVFNTIAYEPWHQFPQKQWEEMQEANAVLMSHSPSLLKGCEKMKEMADAILVETNFISIEACRDYVKEFVEYIKLDELISNANNEKK
jgi:hypothetical protein